MNRTAAVFGLVLIATGIAWTANSAILRVPADYPRIQDGIDAAVDGDTVLVAPGTYTGDGNRDLDFHGKAIKVTSELGAEMTTIDCGGYDHRAFYFHSGEGSSSVVRGFTITNGYYDDKGGAIYCLNSGPSIIGNTFVSNRVEYGFLYGRGGAIYFKGFPITIMNNIFSSNFAKDDEYDLAAHAMGGAIYGENAEVVLTGNSFDSNRASASSFIDEAYAYGGAVYLLSCPAVIERNTFRANEARASGYPPYNQGGGGLYCTGGTQVRNCIFWDNTCLYFPQLGGSVTATYCDVQGGFSGTGNINTAPYFINADHGVLELQHSSPCVDAGDPASPRDPDNTRADMGAFYFDQSVTPSIELYPHDVPIVLPPTGGPVSYDGWVYNLADTSINVDVWTYAILPNQTRYGPIRQFSAVPIRPHARMGMNTIVENVPGIAPAGIYTYVGYVGDFGSTVLDSSYCQFAKSR
jgi:hypothetical protein